MKCSDYDLLHKLNTFTHDRLARLVDDTRVVVDLETTHGVVEDRGHVGDVEEVVKLELSSGEKLFAVWVVLALSNLVVVINCG